MPRRTAQSTSTSIGWVAILVIRPCLHIKLNIHFQHVFVQGTIRIAHRVQCIFVVNIIY